MSSSPSHSSPAPPEKPAPVQFNPQAQYPQYQQMPMQQPIYQPYPSNNDVPRPSKTWNVSKVVLGSFLIVFDIILIAMGAAMIPMTYSYYSWQFLYIIVACVASVSLLWQIAEFITLCVRRKYMGIHPGAHVGVHLILWLACVVLIGIGGTVVYYDIDDYENRDSYYYSSYYDDDDPASIHSFFRMEQAELAFSVLLLIGHFVLFILACIETDRRNKATRGMPRTVYVVGPPPPGHASVYYAPAPTQGMPQGMPQGYPYPPMQFYPQHPQQPQEPQPARVNGDSNPAAYGYYAPSGAPMQTQATSRHQPHSVGGSTAEYSSTPVSSVAGPSGSNAHERVDVERV